MPLIQGYVRAKITTPIFLGRQGENGATQVVFDISEWRRRFGDSGEIRLYHKRPKDQFAYGIALSTADDNNSVVWTVSAIDTDQQAHYGQAELQYIIGTRIVKSELYRTEVAPSIGEFVERYPSVDRQNPSIIDLLVTYVGVLPEIGEEKRLYFVPADTLRAKPNNKYDEYIWIDAEQSYEQIGNVDINSDYDVFMAKMNAVFYNHTHTILFGRFISPDTTKITCMKCLDETYYETEISLTYITEKNGLPVETSHRVMVDENGWLELRNSTAPLELDSSVRTLIFAEAIDAVREGNELAHEPIPLRLDFSNNDWIDFYDLPDWYTFLNTVGIEYDVALVNPKPTVAHEYDQLLEKCYSDNVGIYDIIHADENGYYYRNISFENGIIPADKDVYQYVYTRRSQ